MRRILYLTVIISGCFILASAGAILSMLFLGIFLEGPINASLGFTHGSPFFQCGDQKKEVFTISAVQEGGVFDRAGFHENDIVKGMGIMAFYWKLYRDQGSTVTIAVVNGGDGPALEERPIRHLEFFVPSSRQKR